MRGLDKRLSSEQWSPATSMQREADTQVAAEVARLHFAADGNERGGAPAKIARHNFANFPAVRVSLLSNSGRASKIRHHGPTLNATTKTDGEASTGNYIAVWNGSQL